MRSRSMHLYLSILVSLTLAVLIALLLEYTGLASFKAQELTGLAQIYLAHVAYPGSPWTSMSTEVVTSVIWDQRGFDTYFETSVLFLAIAASLLVLEKTGSATRLSDAGNEVTVIVRTVVKPVVLIVAVVSVSVALHGHLTPGGGFQGGSIFVIAPLLVLLALGISPLYKAGFTPRKLLGVRALAVTLIFVLGVIPLAYSIVSGGKAYLFQNLAKPYSQFSFPALVETPMGPLLLSGTLFWLNFFEFLAVSSGFTLALIYLTREFEGGDAE